MRNIGIKKQITSAKNASRSLLNLNAKKRKKILLAISRMLIKNKKSVLEANRKDTNKAKINHNDSFIERLTLNEEKIKSIADSISVIARAEDVLFKTVQDFNGSSGIRIKKKIYPLGLVAIIYESRPNVTTDAFALAFKSGNAIILKGGKEIKNTNNVLIKIIKEVLKKFELSTDIVQDVSGIDKKLALSLMKDTRIDCLIPRGGKNLINFVSKNSRVPIIITGASVVHTYVDKSADLELAKKIVLNAKTRRVSICNALDVLLIHKNICHQFLSKISESFQNKNVEIRADKNSYDFLKEIKYSKLKRVKEKDFDTEFLDYIIAIKTVENFEEAMDHIMKHSLGHSEAIITKDQSQAKKFFALVDAACLYLNTSTQFSDGGEFGMEGEIGISTQKLHARGPFSYQELTTYKYLIESNGRIRPCL